MTDTPKLRGMATVSYWTADWLAAKAWYTELIGVEPYFQRNGHAERRLGDSQDELGLIDGTNGSPNTAVVWLTIATESVLGLFLGPRRGSQHRGRRRGPGGWTCDAELVVVVFDAELWTWDARRGDSWTFVSLPAEASEEIRDLAVAEPRRGFGSIRVRVTVGASTWTTSVFPGSAGGSYVLPIKRTVRKAEAIDVGDIVTVTVQLIDL